VKLKASLFLFEKEQIIFFFLQKDIISQLKALMTLA